MSFGVHLKLVNELSDFHPPLEDNFIIKIYNILDMTRR